MNEIRLVLACALSITFGVVGPLFSVYSPYTWAAKWRHRVLPACYVLLIGAVFIAPDSKILWPMAIWIPVAFVTERIVFRHDKASRFFR